MNPYHWIVIYTYDMGQKVFASFRTRRDADRVAEWHNGAVYPYRGEA